MRRGGLSPRDGVRVLVVRIVAVVAINAVVVTVDVRNIVPRLDGPCWCIVGAMVASGGCRAMELDQSIEDAFRYELYQVESMAGSPAGLAADEVGLFLRDPASPKEMLLLILTLSVVEGETIAYSFLLFVILTSPGCFHIRTCGCPTQVSRTC